MRVSYSRAGACAAIALLAAGILSLAGAVAAVDGYTGYVITERGNVFEIGDAGAGDGGDGQGSAVAAAGGLGSTMGIERIEPRGSIIYGIGTDGTLRDARPHTAVPAGTAYSALVLPEDPRCEVPYAKDGSVYHYGDGSECRTGGGHADVLEDAGRRAVFGPVREAEDTDYGAVIHGGHGRVIFDLVDMPHGRLAADVDLPTGVTARIVDSSHDLMSLETEGRIVAVRGCDPYGPEWNDTSSCRPLPAGKTRMGPAQLMMRERTEPGPGGAFLARTQFVMPQAGGGAVGLGTVHDSYQTEETVSFLAHGDWNMTEISHRHTGDDLETATVMSHSEGMPNVPSARLESKRVYGNIAASSDSSGTTITGWGRMVFKLGDSADYAAIRTAMHEHATARIVTSPYDLTGLEVREYTVSVDNCNPGDPGYFDPAICRPIDGERFIEPYEIWLRERVDGGQYHALPARFTEAVFRMPTDQWAESADYAGLRLPDGHGCPNPSDIVRCLELGRLKISHTLPAVLHAEITGAEDVYAVPPGDAFLVVDVPQPASAVDAHQTHEMNEAIRRGVEVNIPAVPGSSTIRTALMDRDGMTVTTQLYDTLPADPVAELGDGVTVLDLPAAAGNRYLVVDKIRSLADMLTANRAVYAHLAECCNVTGIPAEPTSARILLMSVDGGSGGHIAGMPPDTIYEALSGGETVTAGRTDAAGRIDSDRLDGLPSDRAVTGTVYTYPNSTRHYGDHSGTTVLDSYNGAVKRIDGDGHLVYVPAAMQRISFPVPVSLDRVAVDGVGFGYLERAYDAGGSVFIPVLTPSRAIDLVINGTAARVMTENIHAGSPTARIPTKTSEAFRSNPEGATAVLTEVSTWGSAVATKDGTMDIFMSGVITGGGQTLVEVNRTATVFEMTQRCYRTVYPSQTAHDGTTVQPHVEELEPTTIVIDSTESIDDAIRQGWSSSYRDGPSDDDPHVWCVRSSPVPVDEGGLTDEDVEALTDRSAYVADLRGTMTVHVNGRIVDQRLPDGTEAGQAPLFEGDVPVTVSRIDASDSDLPYPGWHERWIGTYREPCTGDLCEHAGDGTAFLGVHYPAHPVSANTSVDVLAGDYVEVEVTLYLMFEAQPLESFNDASFASASLTFGGGRLTVVGS